MAIYNSEPSTVLVSMPWPFWAAAWTALVNEIQGPLFGGGILRKLSLPLLGALSLLLLFVLSEVKMAGATEAYCNYEAIP